MYSFDDKLAFSRGMRERTDIETLKKIIHGCVSVEKTSEFQDKKGVDYIATLRKGSQILIDAKTRERGCSKFWRNGPEAAPEIWSVRPGGKYNISKEKSKTGWTLSEKSDVDYIYLTWDEHDSKEVYLLPFQLYRSAFVRNIKKWKQKFKVAIQDSFKWESECVFVPISIILESILNEMEAYKYL